MKQSLSMMVLTTFRINNFPQQSPVLPGFDPTPKNILPILEAPLISFASALVN